MNIFKSIPVLFFISPAFSCQSLCPHSHTPFFSGFRIIWFRFHISCWYLRYFGEFYLFSSIFPGFWPSVLHSFVPSSDNLYETGSFWNDRRAGLFLQKLAFPPDYLFFISTLLFTPHAIFLLYPIFSHIWSPHHVANFLSHLLFSTWHPFPYFWYFHRFWLLLLKIFVSFTP